MTATSPAAEEAVPTSKIAKALAIIEKRPGIRSDDLARAMGIEARSIRAYIGKAMESGFVTTCKVAGKNGPDTLEFRLQTGSRAADWESHKFTRRAETLGKALTPAKPVRRAGSEAKGSSKIGGEMPAKTMAPSPANFVSMTGDIDPLGGDPNRRYVAVADGIALVSQETIELAHWLNLAHDYDCSTPDDIRQKFVTLDGLVDHHIANAAESWEKSTQAEQTAENYARQKQMDDDALKVAKARIDELAEKTKNYEVRIAELQAELNRRLEGSALALSAILTSKTPILFATGAPIPTEDGMVIISKTHSSEEEAIAWAKERAVSQGVESGIFVGHKIGTVQLKAEFVPLGEPA